MAEFIVLFHLQLGVRGKTSDIRVALSDGAGPNNIHLHQDGIFHFGTYNFILEC